MSDKEAVSLIWFKRDLRVQDHRPLFEAAKSGKVIPVYIFENEYWNLPDTSKRHWSFIRDCILELRLELKKIGGNLIFRKGSVLDVFNDLKNQFHIKNIYAHQETGNDWTFKRDIKIIEWCKNNSINFIEFPTNGVVRRLENRDFWGKIKDDRYSTAITPKPLFIKLPDNLLEGDIEQRDSEVFKNEKIGYVQLGGRKDGEKFLNKFLNDGYKNYLQTISKPGISARNCSRLSPHIAYGTLSVKEVLQKTELKIKTIPHNEENEYELKNLQAFISRLNWQSHFVQKLETQPSIEYKCIHPAFENIRKDFNESFFESWKAGTTGIPIIDACMRSLHENGWITFRMRAMLVSFASYQLWLDWRKTAPFMAKLFTDYEPGIHYSQFQMQSGTTGINTFRIYSPVKQSYQHDKYGKFIKRFVPELKNVPIEFIHEPWKMSDIQQKDINIIIGKDYPKPIIDVEQATKSAKDNIYSILKTEGFNEVSSEILKKLSSRRTKDRRSFLKPISKTDYKENKQFTLL